MAEIVARLGQKPEQRQASPVAAKSESEPERRSLQLTLDDIVYPAYMVNYNFELTWYNEAARKDVIAFDVPPPGSESRSIFLMMLNSPIAQDTPRLSQLLHLHLAFAKARLSKATLLGILKNLTPDHKALIDKLYDESVSVTGDTVVEVPYIKHDEGKKAESWQAYGIFFREGILIVHIPLQQADPGILEFLARRDVVIRNLLRKRLPVLTPLAVIVADLQNSVKICSELPPEEYFELINEIWTAMAPLFRKYYGVYGKHVGDGMVYYFFPQPDSNYIFNALACADEIKQEMRKISKAWQLRKNWLNELYLNTGLHEGQEWLGTFLTSTSVEFAVLGDTINHAARLSDFARFGAIWATKNFVSKLTTEERAKVEFGVARSGQDGREHFVVSSYSQLGSLVDLTSERYEKLREISTLPITEIRSVKID